MNFQIFSPKQLKTLTWWANPQIANNYDALICDGAVRSGKTICMSISFVAWAMSSFNGQAFAICGKTVTSCQRNVITNLLPVLEQGTGMSCNYVQSKNYIEIRQGDRRNVFYVFGGRDESSASLIQGVTLAGILLDEVALMPRSFVEQALARCSVEGSKFWFNCNPEHPFHWFYTEWIQEREKKRALYIHFTMDDNPSLSQNIKDRYQSLYSGVFYDRYIRGLWVVAEGIVYPMFNTAYHVVPAAPRPYERYYTSADYGTVNPMSMGLWGLANGKWYRIKEYYWNSRNPKNKGALKTDEEYYAELVKLADGYRIQQVIVDPSAASFIQCIKRHGKFNVMPANNDVLMGIRQVADCLKNGLLFFNDCCKDTQAEFAVYSWDSKAKEDKPIKENDHAMDDIRYFVNTVVKKNPTGWGYSNNIRI